MTKSTFKSYVKEFEKNLKDYGNYEVIQLEDGDKIVVSLAIKKNGYLNYILQVSSSDFELHNLLTVGGFVNSKRLGYIEEALKQAKEWKRD